MGIMGTMQPLTVRGAYNRSYFDACETREKFKEYYLSREGLLTQQVNYVNSFGESLQE